MAPNTHAALSREGQSVYSSYQHLAQTLNRYLAGKNTKIPVLFMDSFDFSGNTYPHYENLKTLPLKQLVLVADDSHGIGILGKDGGGAYGQLAGLPAKELIVCGSLGKALGLQGGFVLGLSKRIESLMRTPIFAGASPTSPANMATLVAATPIFAENRESLFTKVRLFESECLCLDRFSFMGGYPVYGYEDDALTASLFASGIFVTDFKYPSVQPNALPGRIVLSAHHTKADIRRLAGFLNSHYTNQ